MIIKQTKQILTGTIISLLMDMMGEVIISLIRDGIVEAIISLMLLFWLMLRICFTLVL